MIGRPRNLDGAKCPQMIGDELGIEEPVVAGPEPRHQMDEGDLGRVAREVEHALAEKSAAEADAIEAADQLAVFVHLDRVAVAALVELAIEIADARVDPGARAPGIGCEQPAMTPSKSRSTTTVKRPERTVRARRSGTWNRSSGMTPRRSGSIQ